MTRRILLVTNVTRLGLRRHTRDLAELFGRAGLQAAMLPEDIEALGASALDGVVAADPARPADGAELVCVLGGDGTILRDTAAILGNTPRICERCYVDPRVFEGWEDGRLQRVAANARSRQPWRDDRARTVCASTSRLRPSRAAAHSHSPQ